MKALLLIVLFYSLNTILLTRLRSFGVNATLLTLLWFGLVFFAVAIRSGYETFVTGTDLLQSIRALSQSQLTTVAVLFVLAALFGAGANLIFISEAGRIPAAALSSIRSIEPLAVAILSLLLVRFGLLANAQTPKSGWQWAGLLIILAGASLVALPR